MNATRTAAEIEREIAELEGIIESGPMTSLWNAAIEKFYADQLYEARIDLEIALHPEDYETPVSHKEAA